MPNERIVTSIGDITEGSLLKFEDYSGIWSINAGIIPKTTFTVEIPAIHSFSRNRNFSEASYILTKELTSLNDAILIDTRARIPILKRSIVMDLLLSWYQAQIYIEVAQSLSLGDQSYFERRRLYQQSVILFYKASLKYKELIGDLLPYFEPEDREKTKIYLLCDTIAHCAVSACIDLEYGLAKDIEEYSNYIEATPIIIIDSWEYLFSISVALFSEYQSLCKAVALYKFEEYRSLQQHETPLIKSSKIKRPLHASDSRHENLMLTLQKNRLDKLKDKIIEFKKLKSEIKINPSPSEENEKIVQNSSILLKGIMFFSKVCRNHHADEENAPLIEWWSNYIPLYISPRGATNSIDLDIIKLEYNLQESQNCIDQSNTNYLESLQNSVKLLALTLMRYKTYLSSNVTSYFRLFEPTLSLNQKQYYKILHEHLKIIFKFLNNIVREVKSKSIETCDLAEIRKCLKEIKQIIDDVSNVNDKVNCDQPVVLALAEYLNKIEVLTSEIAAVEAASTTFSNLTTDVNGLHKRNLQLFKT